MTLDWSISDAYPNPESYLGPLPGYFSAKDGTSLFLQLTIANPSIRLFGPEFEFELSADNFLRAPGLPPLAPAAQAVHLGEQIFVYPHGFFVILQLDGSFKLCRF